MVRYANDSPINGNGLLGSIKFKVISQTNTHSTISMVEMKVNEMLEGGFLVDDGKESGNIAKGFEFHITSVPDVFALNRNYPNPFNPTTKIRFDLPRDSEVHILVYDIKGSLVDELINGQMEAGYHELLWNGSQKASGVYFIRMISDNGSFIKNTKMMLLK